jgi:hypothetical protein
MEIKLQSKHYDLGREMPSRAGQSGASDDAFTQLENEVSRLAGPWLAQREIIRQRAAAWISSPQFLSCYYDDAHIPEEMKAELRRTESAERAAELIAKLAVFGEQSPQLLSRYYELVSNGEVWFATPLMSNPNFNKHPQALLPCALVVPLDQTTEQLALSTLFSDHAYSIYAGLGDDSRHPVTARMVGDDEYRLFYREMFPLEESNGMRMMYMGVVLKKEWMPPDDVGFVPILALPGPCGAVVQIPWAVATSQRLTDANLKPGRYAQFTLRHYKGATGLLRRAWHMVVAIIQLIFFLGLAAGVVHYVVQLFGK